MQQTCPVKSKKNIMIQKKNQLKTKGNRTSSICKNQHAQIVYFNCY